MRWIALVFSLLAVTVMLPAERAAAEAPPPIPVVAFYYPWYNSSDFSRATMFDVPAVPYDSDARSTIERQVKEAQNSGITGFISSWWGRGNRTDKNFATLMDVSKNARFAATVYFECGAPGLSSPGEVVDQLRYIMSTYGSNPSFLKLEGKPAIFFWMPGAVGSVSTWRSIRDQVDPDGQWHWNVETDRPDGWLDVFDGFHLFSAASWSGDPTALYQGMRAKADAASERTGQKKLWVAGVAPGWDNSRQDQTPQVVVDRGDGSYYGNRWDAAVASNPDAISVTSWNEWGEGTAIEPGASYGNLYLDITKDHAAGARRVESPPASPDPSTASAGQGDNGGEG